ncbi:MAG: hypothetical protein KC464_00170 [Myxococcales bacterium]|nr:hypothetical protein [Myxococcales bacterium]
MAPPLWTYAAPPTEARDPEVVLFAFSHGPLRDDVPMSLARFGAPDAAQVAAVEVRTIPRAVEPAWFDAWRSGSLRAIAETDLGAGLAALDGADHVHLVRAAPTAPADLGYLQTAWALARFLVARGATTILDAHAATFRAGDALPGPDAPLDVRAEVRVVFETDPTRGDLAHALHTRGMRKFGAPDLIALCGDADAALVSEVVGQLADRVARGETLASPRHAVDLDPSTTWYVVDDHDGLGALLQLNNRARVLVDASGAHLVGARDRRALN